MPARGLLLSRGRTMTRTSVLAVAGCLAVMGALTMVVPHEAAATPRVSAIGALESDGTLHVRGRAVPGRAGWRAQLFVLGTRADGRRTWTLRGRPVLLGRRGHFSLWTRVAALRVVGRVRVRAGRGTSFSPTFVVTRPSRGAPMPIVGAGEGRSTDPPPSGSADVTAPQPPAATPSPPSPPPPSPPPPSTRLEPGQLLRPGASLASLNGQYRLVMQAADGNLVLYRGPTAVWWTGPAGAGAHLAMQRDGNLVVYQGSSARWNSNTRDFSGTTLVLQNDGNLVLYHANRAVWTRGTGYIGHRLEPGMTLAEGTFLRSPDARFRLRMQGDGNLVQYGPGGAVWAWETAGNPGARAIMQTDGNLVIYRGSSPVRWTGTQGHGGGVLVLQDDGNLVLYSGASPLWTRRSAAARSWAAAQLGQRTADPEVASWFSWTGPYAEWSGDCPKLVVAAWRKAGVDIYRGDAVEQYEHYRSRLRGGHAPEGALVFWPNETRWGHVAISDGAGHVYTTQGLDGANLPIARVPIEGGPFGSPAGWVMP